MSIDIPWSRGGDGMLHLSTARRLWGHFKWIDWLWVWDMPMPWILFVIEWFSSPMGAYCMWCSDLLMQTSALIKHPVNDRSFSKQHGSSFQDSISIVSFSLSTGHQFRSYSVSLFLFLCLSQSFIPQSGFWHLFQPHATPTSIIMPPRRK